MIVRLLGAIGVREGEGARLGRLVALIFALSAAVVIAKAAQSGIFLSAYPRSAIPIAFIYSAIVLASTSFLASALAERLGPVKLTAVALAVSAAVLAGGRLLLSSGIRGVPLAIYVGVEAMTGLLLIQGWAVVTEAVDVRSAKRLLPLVGNGASIAWAAGGFGTSVLVKLVGTPGLLILAPCLLLVALVLVRVVEKKDLGGRGARGSRAVSLWAGARAGLRYVAVEPLMRVLAAIAVLALLIEQVLDYQLLAATRDRYVSHPEYITGFMGLYYGITGVITVVAQLGLSGRLLSRLGSARAALTSPAIVALGSVAVAAGLPLFPLIVGLRGADRVLKQALGSPALEQIHIPIPPVRRSQARALVKGVLAPLFYAVGGFALQFVPAGLSLRWLSLGTIALAGTSALIAGTWLHRAYVAALRRAVDQRRLDLAEASSQRPGLDKEQCAALAADVRSGEPKRALFAIDLLTRGEPGLARPILQEALGQPSPEIRAGAAAALAKFGRSEDARKVAKALEQATEDVVERACLSALGALGTQGLGSARSAVLRRTADENPEVRALARASLARTGDDEANAALAEMMRSTDDRERAAGAWAMGELMLRQEALVSVFADLLSDASPAVRSAALRATGQLQQPRFVRAVAWALSDRETAASAVHSVGQWSDALVERLDEALRGAPVRAVARATAALAHNQGPHGDAFLSRLVVHDDPVVRYRAARALAARRRAAPRRPLNGEDALPPRPTLLAAVRRELALGYGYYALLVGVARTDGVEDYEIEPQFAFLANELLARIRRVERRLFALLALVADPRMVHAAELRLRNQNPSVAAQAVELLEHAIDPELSALVVPFFERRPLRMRLQAARGILHVATAYIEDPLGGIMALGDPHLRRCAMWTYRDRFAREYPAEHREESRLLPLVERIYFLRGIPLFAELSGEDLRQVAEIVEEVEFDAGDVIFRKGDPGEALYLVVRGRVVARDGSIEIARFGPKEFFGDLAVLDHEPRSTDVVCTDDAQLLRIAAADLEELMERRPEIANAIIKVLARRLREANQRIADLPSQTLKMKMKTG